MNQIRIVNETRGSTLVSRGHVADRYFPRLLGLMGRAALAEGEGLVILPSNSVHTHFMRFPIDVLYVNSDLEIVAIDHGMKPWRFGRIHRQARLVIELPAGRAAATGTEVGDRLAILGYEKRIA